MPTGVYKRKPRPLRDPMPRFWRKVKKTETCWLWTAGTRGGSYGEFWFAGRNVPAHRFLYERLHGPLPPRLFACHTCDRPLCVKPEHVFPGTTKDNAQDAIRKGRWNYEKRHSEKYVRGERNHKAKLTAGAVQKIRRLAGTLSLRELAVNFGVTKYAIFSALHRLTWRHVP